MQYRRNWHRFLSTCEPGRASLTASIVAAATPAAGDSMIRQPVNSSDLKSVGYDPGHHLLEIEFLNGSVYQYDGVPPAVFDGLMAAGSHGSYFHAHIRGRYLYRRVN
jgi:hypothetical protein